MSLFVPTRLPVAARSLAETPVMRGFERGQRAPGVEIRLRPRRYRNMGDAGHDFVPPVVSTWLAPLIVPQTGENIP